MIKNSINLFWTKNEQNRENYYFGQKNEKCHFGQHISGVPSDVKLFHSLGLAVLYAASNVMRKFLICSLSPAADLLLVIKVMDQL